VPTAPLFAVQGADGRWLVYFEAEKERVIMLFFTSEEAASRYINAHPDLLDSPGYSLVLISRNTPQFMRVARLAHARGVQTFQVDRCPSGACRFQIELDPLLSRNSIN
jgi:hypothetical protein